MMPTQKLEHADPEPRPNKLRAGLLVSTAVDGTISRLFPDYPSGEHDLPSQHEFFSQAMPLIIEEFATRFDEMAMPVPARPDIREASFQDLLVPLVTVTGQRVYNFTGVGEDHILLTKLTITPTREIYEGDVPESE